jgi:hypothetical protein
MALHLVIGAITTRLCKFSEPNLTSSNNFFVFIYWYFDDDLK